MAEENKKISFGFSKLTKRPNLFGKPLEKQKKVDLIECLESQTIKIKDGYQKEIKGPLIIPMAPSTNIFDRRKDIKTEKVQDNSDNTPDSELTVEELAARELIREAQSSAIQRSTKVFTLPNVATNIIEVEGKEESTLEDYESVPISDYGLAMLRGMGWSEELGIGKNNKKIKVVEPPLRPKGMGLGATKSYNMDHKAKPALDKDGKELSLVKGGFAKITDGKKKGCYCEIQGFDDESGRIIVKTSLDGSILSLNEFFVTPITKEEYDKSSKVINIVKYEEYKSKDQKRDEHCVNEKDSKKSSSHKYKKKSNRDRSSSSIEDSDYTKRKPKREHHEYKKDKHKKKSKKHKHQSSDSESNYKKDKSKYGKHVYSKR